MKTDIKTWTRPEDKEALPPGVWRDEPDKAVWIDPTTDLDCMINRNRMGALCGYVGVDPTHRLHGLEYHEHVKNCPHAVASPYMRGPKFCACEEPTPERIIEVHGGLTFSGSCMESEDPAEGICHVPEPGRSHDIWWFGFDCGHAWDLSPRLQAELDAIIPNRETERMMREAINAANNIGDMWRETYRTFGWVKEEVTRLAAQVHRLR